MDGRKLRSNLIHSVGRARNHPTVNGAWGFGDCGFARETWDWDLRLGTGTGGEKSKEKKVKEGGTSRPLFFFPVLLLVLSWGCGNSQVRDKIRSPSHCLARGASARGDIPSVRLRYRRKLSGRQLALSLPRFLLSAVFLFLCLFLSRFPREGSATRPVCEKCGCPV